MVVQRLLKKAYVVVFIMVLFLPFLLAHREENRVAADENRYYANVPRILGEDKKLNPNYISEFEAWIDDNARFRSLFRETKVTLLYKLFNYLDLEGARVGTNGEMYDTEELAINTMQGRNLLSETELNSYEENLYQLQQWLANRDIDFYYMQCYHKITVLDEGYPRGLVRYDTEYIGENTENFIMQKNRVNIVPLHDTMEMAAKEQNTYLRYIDWCHWNDAGMYLGYKSLIQAIQKKHPEVDYLKMEDYDIALLESYKDVYGFRYPLVENVPSYQIKEVKAAEKECVFNDRLSTKAHTHYFENPEQEKRILVINDSFIRMGLKNHLAESFGECLSIDMYNLSNVEWIVEEYKPDIVVLECVETNISPVKEMLDGLECIKVAQ